MKTFKNAYRILNKYVKDTRLKSLASLLSNHVIIIIIKLIYPILMLTQFYLIVKINF